MYHHGSCSLNTLFSHLETISNEFIRNQNKEEIKKLGDKPKQKEVTAINKKYKERLTFSLMTNKNNIQSVLCQFKRLKAQALNLII